MSPQLDCEFFMYSDEILLYLQTTTRSVPNAQEIAWEGSRPPVSTQPLRTALEQTASSAFSLYSLNYMLISSVKKGDWNRSLHSFTFKFYGFMSLKMIQISYF